MEDQIIDFAVMLLETEHDETVVHDFLRAVDLYRRTKSEALHAKAQADKAARALRILILQD